MKIKKITSSILDFPRKTLSEDIWQYSNIRNKIDELPRLKPEIKNIVVEIVKKNLNILHLNLISCHLLGGAASYQWSEGTDIDISAYADNWPNGISQQDIEKYQEFFRKTKIPYKSYEIHFFLKSPDEPKQEIAEGVYDVLSDEWLLPPLLLPKHFDPDEYFKPFIKEAEAKAKKFDTAIGELRRAWSIMEKVSKARSTAKEPDLVNSRIIKEKKVINEVTDWLSKKFIAIRDKRYEMHDALKEKMKKNVEIGRFERFQEPEIIWKYLDRAGYNDFLWKIYKLKTSNQLEKILSNY